MQLSPDLRGHAIGVIKDATHSTDLGLYMLAALMVIGGLAELALPKRGKPSA